MPIWVPAGWQALRVAFALEKRVLQWQFTQCLALCPDTHVNRSALCVNSMAMLAFVVGHLSP